MTFADFNSCLRVQLAGKTKVTPHAGCDGCPGPPTAGVWKLSHSPRIRLYQWPNDDLWSILKRLVTGGAAERGATFQFISNQANGATGRSPTHRRIMWHSQQAARRERERERPARCAHI